MIELTVETNTVSENFTRAALSAASFVRKATDTDASFIVSPISERVSCDYFIRRGISKRRTEITKEKKKKKTQLGLLHDSRCLI